jgi:hypothetical protein
MALASLDALGSLAKTVLTGLGASWKEGVRKAVELSRLAGPPSFWLAEMGGAWFVEASSL